MRCNDGKRNRKSRNSCCTYLYSYSDFYDSWANRIVPAIAIPHPLGNPALDQEEEKKLRRGIVEKALEALTTEVDGQKVFE